MSWTTPKLTDIKMDAEIGAYQPDDYGQEPTVPFVQATPKDDAADAG